MKEAAGEANLTVVAIILIAVVVAVATPLVTSLMNNAAYRSCCSDAGATWKGGNCTPSATDTASAQKDSYDTCLKEAGKESKKWSATTATSN